MLVRAVNAVEVAHAHHRRAKVPRNVLELMKDLRSVSCDIMTIGQYLQPHARRLPVERYVTPEEFDRWHEIGMDMGFKHVQSSPLTRSSYHAREQAAP